MKVSKRAAVAAALVAAAGAAIPSFADSHNTGNGSAFCADGTMTWTPSTLWAPNHKLQTIDIYYTAPTDTPETPGDKTTLTITGIDDNQLLADGAEEAGSGQPTAQQGLDWNVVTPTDTVDEGQTAHVVAQVRAERAGSDPAGRTYTIHLACSESNNATPVAVPTTDSGTADATVVVPHDQRKTG